MYVQGESGNSLSPKLFGKDDYIGISIKRRTSEADSGGQCINWWRTFKGIRTLLHTTFYYVELGVSKVNVRSPYGAFITGIISRDTVRVYGTRKLIWRKE